MTFAPEAKFVPDRFVIEILVVFIPVAGIIPDIVGFAALAVPTNSIRPAKNRQYQDMCPLFSSVKITTRIIDKFVFF
jgi:hypothetical protein